MRIRKKDNNTINNVPPIIQPMMDQETVAPADVEVGVGVAVGVVPDVGEGVAVGASGDIFPP